MLKALAILAISGVLGIATLLGSLWLEHRYEVKLPTPTGPFPVGRVISVWADNAHSDTLAPALETKRELLVWIRYPSAGGHSVVMDGYLPAELRPKAAVLGAKYIRTLLTRELSNLRGHSARDPDVSPPHK